MPIRVAIVGPGRVGKALGRRMREAGVEVLGFVGRSEASAAEACSFLGSGRPLALAELSLAHVVMFSVSDPALADAVRAAVAAAAPRSCSLWIHTSARHDLAVFEPLATKGVRIGALHPVAPFPDAATGCALLDGKPALLVADPRGRRLLGALTQRLGMRPLWCQPGGSRELYHAACAMAANGLTALRATVDATFAHSGCLSPQDAAVAADALMRAALDLCASRGPVAALSGPVVRGDAVTLRAHRAALRAVDPTIDATYAALMAACVPLARDRGLAEARIAEALRALLPEVR